MFRRIFLTLYPFLCIFLLGRPPVFAQTPFNLKQISLDSTPSQISIKIEATGGLAQVREQKMLNPGRLILEIEGLTSTTKLNINALTDHLIIPRIRIAQYSKSSRIIIDTVLKTLPPFTLQKTSETLELKFEKSPELIQEAKSQSEVFLSLQRSDRESFLKLGSEDEGGVLFDQAAQDGRGMVRPAPASEPRSGGGKVRIEPGSGGANRVVFVLDDQREQKIFIEDSQTPIHIERIRPAYEVKGIQSRLSQLGYPAGLADGDAGPQTREALKAFQKDHQLPVTGAPDKKTQRELRKQFGY